MAVLATLTDETIKKLHGVKSVTAVNLMEEGELKHCETFLSLMQPLYHATLAMSADQKPTVGVVLPLLNKLKRFCDPAEGDTTLQPKIRKAVVDNLETRYTDEQKSICACRQHRLHQREFFLQPEIF